MTEAPGGVLIALALVVLVAPSGAAPTVFAQVPPALAIDVADMLGRAAAIGDLLGVQAGPATVGRREDVDRWVYAAWHALGLRANPITVFEPDGGVRVSLDRTGRPRVNFKALDDAVRYYAGSLETKRPDFSLGPTPQALSSRPRDKHYQHYAPQSYDDWRDVVGQTVKHIKEHLRIGGATYWLAEEYDNCAVWRGRSRCRDGDIAPSETLDDLLELYVNTWRAVRTADPTAKVGAPGTISYATAINKAKGWATWGFDEFIAGLAQYNAKNPGSAVTLDKVAWQDYDWTRSGRLSDGVAHVRQVLARHGFSPRMPLVVIGWNTNYGDNIGEIVPCGTDALARRASFFVSNIIRELAPGGQRGLSEAYLWPFDHDNGCPRLAVITAPAAAFDGFAPVKEFCKRPAYAGLQMLRAMATGSVVRAAAAQPLEALASMDRGRVVATAVNHSESARPLTMRFHNLPFRSGAAAVTVRRVDDGHSAGCSGLEAGASLRATVADGSTELSFQLPAYGIVQVTLSSR